MAEYRQLQHVSNSDFSGYLAGKQLETGGFAPKNTLRISACKRQQIKDLFFVLARKGLCASHRGEKTMFMTLLSVC